MRNLTSPQAILLGLGFIAFAIASIPYSSNLITPAIADSHNEVQKVILCSTSMGHTCGQQFDQNVYIMGGIPEIRGQEGLRAVLVTLVD